MRLGFISCLLVLAVSGNAAARTLYTEINRLRMEEGACAVAGNLPPLQPQPALERVARDLARGDRLEQSLQANGYRDFLANYPIRLSADDGAIGDMAGDMTGVSPSTGVSLNVRRSVMA